MDIPLDVEVRCTDGPCGKSAAIIVDPKTEQVTHVVVEADGTRYLVPVEAIAGSAPDQIQLGWTREELTAAARFEKVALGDDGTTPLEMPGMTGASMAWPYGMDGDYMLEAAAAAYMPVEQVPVGERAIHSGAYVEAAEIGRAHV